MAAAGVLAFAGMLGGLAVAVAFAGVDAVAVHLVAGIDGLAHAAGRILGCEGNRGNSQRGSGGGKGNAQFVLTH